MTAVLQGELAALIIHSAASTRASALIVMHDDKLETGTEHTLGWLAVDLVGQSAELICNPKERAAATA